MNNPISPAPTVAATSASTPSGIGRGERERSAVPVVQAPAPIGAAARSAGAASQETRGAAPPSREAVEAAARQLESFLRESGRELEFRVDDSSGRVVISVRDPVTGDLIRQIPDPIVLALAERLRMGDTGAGVLVEAWS
jgi:flagellar protein FlaG